MVFATKGSKTFTLACLFSSGQKTASSTAQIYPVTTYTHSVDPQATTYPGGYRVASTKAAEVYQNRCTVGPVTVSYPKAWIGRYGLPTPRGAPLPLPIQRGIGIKDVWQPSNPSFDPACEGTTTARAELTRTLARLKALGTDYVNITPWTSIGRKADGTWYIVNPGDRNSSTMSDADLAWAVSEAHRLGLKVTWLSQIQDLYNGTNGEIVPQTRENVARFLKAYEPYLVSRAAYLQSIGIDTMSVSCSCFTVLESESYQDLYTASMARALPKVRSAFSGRIRMALHPAVLKNTSVRQSVDEVSLALYANVQPGEVAGLTVATLASKFGQAIQGNGGIYPGLDKPVIFTIGAPSRADYFTTGYLEETFCSAGYDHITGADSACIQKAAVTDFSLQAMYYEAYLEAVKSQTTFNVRAVEGSDYWIVDTLKPGATFPNIAFSVRNKPTEGLLKAWFVH